MKFGQRFSIRKGLQPVEMARGIWNPQMRVWRDVIEDYLYISRKRHNNKLSMFKLQLNILNDIAANVEAIDKYKELKTKLEHDFKKGDLSKETFESEMQNINQKYTVIIFLTKH